VSVAHEKGITHRELKPGKVMVTEEDRVKVLDVGLAKLRQEAKVMEDSEAPTAQATDAGRVGLCLESATRATSTEGARQ